MIKPNNVIELALGELDTVVGGGKIGDAAGTVKSGLSKVASDLGEAAIVPTLIPSATVFGTPK